MFQFILPSPCKWTKMKTGDKSEIFVVCFDGSSLCLWLVVGVSLVHPPSAPLRGRKTNSAEEALWQQPQPLLFKWSVLISAFKWMQIRMHDAICGAEYSCGRAELAVPRSGLCAAFLSPSLFWHADKEQQAKNQEERAKSGSGESSRQTSWQWWKEKEANI